MIWCSDKYKKKYPAIINNIKKALHRSFRTDEICNVVFHISQLNTPYYRDKYDLLSPSIRFCFTIDVQLSITSQ